MVVDLVFVRIVVCDCVFLILFIIGIIFVYGYYLGGFGVVFCCFLWRVIVIVIFDVVGVVIGGWCSCVVVLDFWSFYDLVVIN